MCHEFCFFSETNLINSIIREHWRATIYSLDKLLPRRANCVPSIHKMLPRAYEVPYLRNMQLCVVLVQMLFQCLSEVTLLAPNIVFMYNHPSIRPSIHLSIPKYVYLSVQIIIKHTDIDINDRNKTFYFFSYIYTIFKEVYTFRWNSHSTKWPSIRQLYTSNHYLQIVHVLKGCMDALKQFIYIAKAWNSTFIENNYLIHN